MDKESIQTQLEFFDGDDQIIFSNTFNIYQDMLVINNIRGFKFTFIFEKSEIQDGQKDIEILNANKNEAIIKFSRKIRSSLGAGNVDKFPIIKFNDETKLLFSVYGAGIGDASNGLNVTVTFYIRK